ncbi:cytochrome P450, partial [Hyalangium versicolor]|uniref:cytochrome P450 n=1 Tax=Hyalangium versicolor TaxID=2861190 RepID=UPI001CCEB448
EFLPFGGGARRCLGAAFAAFEMRVVLATLVRAARFRLHGDAAIRIVLRNAVVGPSRPIQLALE